MKRESDDFSDGITGLPGAFQILLPPVLINWAKALLNLHINYLGLKAKAIET